MTTKLNLHQDREVLLIRSYANNKILIGKTEYFNNLVVTPTIIKPWSLQTLAALGDQDFDFLSTLDYQPELIILGTGSKLCFPYPAQTRSVINARIGLEVMDTAAACRTYNVLADDGRKVVACLMV